MDRWQGRVAVVTGTSSGIGAAIAKDLVSAGLNVVGLARRKERIDELRNSLPKDAQERLHPLKCDVSDENSVNEAFDWIEEKLGGVDILVNNAAIYVEGQLATQDAAGWQRVLQTNVMGVIYCTQRAFKSMKARNVDGHVVLINSICGHQIISNPGGGLPIVGMYTPSKFAITAITEILRQEFRDFGTKIKVTAVSPGLVDTEMVPDFFKELPMLKAEDISNAVVYAISTPPHVQIHEVIIRPVGELF